MSAESRSSRPPWLSTAIATTTPQHGWKTPGHQIKLDLSRLESWHGIGRARALGLPLTVWSGSELSHVLMIIHSICSHVINDKLMGSVTAFVDKHPGGKEILLENAGSDVTDLFHGIHPRGTLQKHAEQIAEVGRLDATQSLPQSEDEKVNVKGQDDGAKAYALALASVVELDDFEAIARRKCSPSAWDYFNGAAETRSAYDGNRRAFADVTFRPRVMRNVSEVSLEQDILGVKCGLPIYVAPTARNGLATEEGEIAVTKAVGPAHLLQVLSHVASRSLDEVLAAKGADQKIAWQMYMKADRALAEQELKRAVELGAQSVWLTVDTVVPTKHTNARRGAADRNPHTQRDLTFKLSPRHDACLDWKDIAWIKSLAPGVPVVIKGIGAWEDAELARAHGADGIVLSNHGGRALDYANAPLRTLRDITTNAPALIKDPSFQIFIDGGARRGTDGLKALCLGAHAVGMGRPFIYAAAAGETDGVTKAIALLREELEIAMRQLGVTDVKQLGPQYVDTYRL